MSKLTDKFSGDKGKDDPERQMNTAHGLHRPAEAIDAKGLILGDEYTDIISGIKGVADGVYIFLTGCDQVSLYYLKEGEPHHIVVDASRIKELRRPAPAPARKTPGGPARVSPPGSRANIS